MKLVVFDRLRFHDDLVRYIATKPRGYRSRLLAATGVTRSTFYNLQHNGAIGLDTLLSVADYTGLPFSDYVVRKQNGD